MALILNESLRRQIEAEGMRAFPSECCGVLIGLDAKPDRIVERLQPLRNSFETEEQYHRFRLDPKEYIEADKAAGAEGKLVLGFYHSHPDHPARPSEYDRQHAWPFYSYVIVSILQRKPDAMTSWLLNEQTEQFEEEKIVSQE